MQTPSLPRSAHLRKLPGWAALLAAVGFVAPPPVRAQTSASTAGLWTGDVVLQQVTYARKGTVEPTRSPAQLRLLLHADATGKVRLLKEVLIGKPVALGADALLFTTPERMIGKPVVRDDKGAAQAHRLATVAYDFKDTDGTDDNALLLTGSLASGQTVTGTLQLDRDLPTHPFRHKYHPDHANSGTGGFDIARDLKLTISGDPVTVDGALRINANYEETLRGIQRSNLVVRGTVQLTRIAAVATLNP